MKKSLLALATLTAFAGAASAQSSVTIFGIVDVGVMSVKNGSAGTVSGLGQDGVNSSRIGFRGIEDLGGGLRAGFWIEGAFGPDTGCGGAGTQGSPAGAATTSTTVNQATGAPTTTVNVTPTPQLCTGQTWQRRSTVSLLGNFGEVRLGRDYTVTFNNIAAFDPWGYNGVGHVGNLRSALGSGGTTAVRANNTVAYFLPALGGLYGQIQVAAQEGVTGSAATSTGNKFMGGRIGYAAGPINVGAAYGLTEKTGSMIDDLITYNVGASFNAGFLTVMGSYEKQEYSQYDQELALIGVLVPIGPGTLRASYIETRGRGLAGGVGVDVGAKQAGIGYVYDLSKRTALYAQYAKIDNKGNTATGADFRVYGAPTNGMGATIGFRRSETSEGYQVGIRHAF